MTFDELRKRLIRDLRHRIQSGQHTERSLAAIAGISQPHLHNSLKGIRLLSVEMADEILTNLKMGIADLLEPGEIAAWQHRRGH